MSIQRDKPRVGELRPSQILTTFGIGSIVDLPHLSVMVMGLEDWPSTDYREIPEERLLASVRMALGKQVTSLRSPPIIPETDRTNYFEEQSYVGVPVAPFPRWMVCPRCRRLAPLASNQFVLKADPFRPDRVRYVHENCRVPGKLPTVIPARFIVACKNGHLDDFPWVEFVHGGPTKCAYKLQMLEMGPSGKQPMSTFGARPVRHLAPCQMRLAAKTAVCRCVVAVVPICEILTKMVVKVRTTAPCRYGPCYKVRQTRGLL